MNIVIFHNTQFFGGGERHTHHLACTLAGMAHRVRLVDCGVGVYKTIAVPPGVTVELDNKLAEGGIANCWAALSNRPADLAIIITGGLAGFLLSVEVALRLRYRRVCRIEHGCIDRIESYARRYWFGFIPGINLVANTARIRRLIQNTLIQSIFVVSEASKQRLVAYGYARPAGIRVIHNGTNCDQRAIEIRETVRSKLGIAADSVVIICCGRLSHEKGIELAIRAFARCRRDSMTPTDLIVLGIGPLLPALRDLAAELMVQDAVHFLGFQQDVANYLRSSDAIVMPSHTESFPLALLEGMAQGCYPIATRVGGVPEILSRGVPSSLVTPGSVDELVRAMMSFLVLTQHDREIAAISVRSHICSLFDESVQYPLLAEAILEYGQQS